MTESQPVAEIEFPEGLVGLPRLVRHRLGAVPGTALFELLCQDDPDVGFIVATADNVRPGTSQRLRDRGLIAEGEWVLAILSIHGEPPSITANLAGPLVIDMEKASARQLVIEGPEFPLQAPLAEVG